MFNRATLIGNLGADPEIKALPSGGKVANFRVATSEQWRDKETGEKKERTEWHSISVFNEHLVAVVEQYVRKGSKLFVEGSIRTRKWQDQTGQDRYTTEIVLSGFDGTIKLLDKRDGRPPAASSPDDYGTTRTRNQDAVDDPRQAVGASHDDMNDDIPF